MIYCHYNGILNHISSFDWCHQDDKIDCYDGYLKIFLVYKFNHYFMFGCFEAAIMDGSRRRTDRYDYFYEVKE